MGQDGIKYLESLAPWKGKGGFGLDKMRRLMAHLGDPQDRIKVAHVAGTNGKGSVCAFLSSILGASGAKVGLNISPHLEHIRERVVIDGSPIPESDLNTYALEVMAAGKAGELEPSFFEAITAIAFIAFYAESVDFAVVEAGLGGRLDATNIVSNPTIAAVVSVQHDHEDILGQWPLSIAAEKAAIYKAGASCFAGEMVPEALSLLRARAAEVGTSLFAYGHDFSVLPGPNGASFYSANNDRLEYRPSLVGEHQEKNAAIAISIARSLGISISACQLGVAQAFWPGRLERFEYRGKSFLLDCAHNEEGVASLVSYLNKNAMKGLTLIFSAIQTKNWQLMLRMLNPYCNKVVVVEAKAPNAVDTASIADYLSGIGVSNVNCRGDYEAALMFACSGESSNVLVGGSMYMLGPIRAMFKLGPYSIWKRHVG